MPQGPGSQQYGQKASQGGLLSKTNQETEVKADGKGKDGGKDDSDNQNDASYEGGEKEDPSGSQNQSSSQKDQV
jgi:hypothetical protein